MLAAAPDVADIVAARSVAAHVADECQQSVLPRPIIIHRR